MAMVNYLYPKPKKVHPKMVFATLIISSVVFTVLLHHTADAKELQNTGSYSVRLSDRAHHLNCRTGPGTNFPVRIQLEHGETIQVIHATSHSKPWFYTNLRCFVRANSRFLRWRGEKRSSNPEDTKPTITR